MPKISLSVNDLRIADAELLVMLKETQNLAEAARRLDIAPPRATEALDRLDCSFGGPLYQRAPNAGLTELGELMVPHAQALLRCFGQMREHAQRFKDGKRSTPLQVVLNEAIARTWFGDWREEFREQHPEIEVESISHTTADIKLKAGQKDICICTVQVGPVETFHSRLPDLAMSFVGRADRFEDRVYSLLELAQRRLVTFQSNSLPERDLQQLLAAHGLNVPVDRLSSISDLLDAVLSGCVATLPDDVVVRLRDPKLRILRCTAKLKELPMWISVPAASGSEHTEVARESILLFAERRLHRRR
jgi:DNA-binding transcriptional LysR family regulator